MASARALRLRLLAACALAIVLIAAACAPTPVLIPQPQVQSDEPSTAEAARASRRGGQRRRLDPRARGPPGHAAARAGGDRRTRADARDHVSRADQRDRRFVRRHRGCASTARARVAWRPVSLQGLPRSAVARAAVQPARPARVGLQAGHWLNDESPPELGRSARRLERRRQGRVGGQPRHRRTHGGPAREGRASRSTSCPRRFRRATRRTRSSRCTPTATWPAWRAGSRSRGPASARCRHSTIGWSTAERRVRAGAALPRDDEHITLRMRYYYAFNSRRYCHAVAPACRRPSSSWAT